ncbi:hypothetical protein [Jannaschia sp. M317]|uniref:hypothetical protein n=1 Tax=Jannaschia sp. M317 TaxID=2867011 RepID=UPI0021A868BB|nr:hypothetical protein [Jannaschia sp. M317]UWQ17150.1 hypothetical protein K3551_14840 [Jannaschia sp. M317]
MRLTLTALTLTLTATAAVAAPVPHLPPLPGLPIIEPAKPLPAQCALRPCPKSA